MRQIPARLAFATLLFVNCHSIRASEHPEAEITILVYDYVGLENNVLSRAEAEAAGILQHAGVHIVWRGCYSAAGPFEGVCQAACLAMPTLRLLRRFQLVPDQIRADSMGYAVGNLMTVSWQQAEKVARSGAGPLPEILGLIIAHEFGHLLLRDAHTVSGIMHARWGAHDWELARRGWLLFLPAQAETLRREVNSRGGAPVANQAAEVKRATNSLR